MTVLTGAAKGSGADFAIQDRINPNTACAASLSRLEGIGPTRAQSVIDYRENTPRKPAYVAANDLQKIHGFGPKTVEKIQDELIFE